MSRLISVKKLSQALGVKKQAIYNKISRGSLPREVIIYLPNEKRKKVRINLDLLLKIRPNLEQLFDSDKNKESKFQNLIKISDFSKAIDVSISTMYRYINEGLYPYISLPCIGEFRKIRILKNETIQKYPVLKEIIENI